MNEAGKIKFFTDLDTWKEAHKLVLNIYRLVEKFPKKEQFILNSQIIRAVISITSNLAEGFGRRGIKEKIQFYYLAQSSLTEDVYYINNIEFNKVWDQTIIVHKLISGLIRSMKRIKS